MLKCIVRGFMVSLIIFFGCVSISAFATSVDNTANPLTKEKHAGGAINIGVAGADGDDNNTGGMGDAILNVIKSVINWTLGILGLLALMIVIYGGFLILISAGDDEKYSKGRKMLKYALIGLAVIGLAWLVITFVFWLISKAAVNANAVDAV